MKNYKRVNFKSIFMWVITFALTLVVSMGGAFAYFTATAKKQQSNMTTAIIKVGISNTKLTATGQTGALSTKIVPGSTVQYTGVVQNTGTAAIYALLECDVYVDGVLIQTAYYTANGATEMVYSPSEKKYTTESTPIAVDGSQNFNLSFTFDSSYGNEYKGKTAKLYVIAHAIQQSHLTALEATNILLEGSGGG